MTNGDQPAVTSVSVLLAVVNMKTALLASARQRSLFKENGQNYSGLFLKNGCDS